MGWLANKHEFYSFIMFHQNCSQIQSQEHRFSKFSWGYAPRPLAKHTEQDAESGLHIMWARPTLSNAHFKFWCYIIFIIMCIWKTQLSWNLSQPPTLFYFWIIVCIRILLGMLLLGGLRAWLQEILKICSPEIESGSSLDGKLWKLQFQFLWNSSVA